ncbi:monofunctional biosynthetic peptidoglycan transglycosylase [Desulfomicrobium apsheronum]|uniref:Biosynthetic peptidoglycan transglycosylase n=2 Tax=Desulfomicrobium apsheronum TaxID=52560 RepID=A0A1I3UFI0_9BACT|nr:monofunctional biosynthetic peptidoglycan transglycosylase [Desulfomicrobium apsheronum]
MAGYAALHFKFTSSNMARKTTTSSPRRAKPRTAAKKHAASGGPLRRVLHVVGWILPGIVAVILILRFVPPPTSAFIITCQAERMLGLASGPAVMHEWTPMRRIPRHMALAVVAAEDQNFPNHFGFDVDAIARAVEHNKKSQSVRGASTISQQTAKNLFLWSGRSYVRKGLEAGLTVLIELLWSKERILEVYLNIAEFGNGTYGVGAAAKRFFGKTPAGLTTREAALLASVLPNPKRFSAARPSSYLLQRAHWVQTQMKQLGPNHIDWR